MKAIYFNEKENVSDEHISEVANNIKDGKIAVFPTETVYGVGTNATDKKLPQTGEKIAIIGTIGIAVVVTALLVFWFYVHKAMKYFGGTTGDLSGYFLCLCEVWIILVLAVVTVIYKI